MATRLDEKEETVEPPVEKIVEVTDQDHIRQVVLALDRALKTTEQMLIEKGPEAVNWDWFKIQHDLYNEYLTFLRNYE